MKPRRKAIAERACYIYVALLSIWFLLWLFAGDSYWWLTLLNRIALELFLPALLLAPFAFWQPRLIGLMLVPGAMFTYLYGPYLIPRPLPHATQATLRVMTYNVLYNNAHSSVVAQVIQEYAPDLVALQEVQPDRMAALREQLQSDYPWSMSGAEHPFGTTAVFSRHAFVGGKVLDLEADRTAVVVQVTVAGQEVTFISAHLLAYNLQFVALPDIPQTVARLSAQQRHQAVVLAKEVEQQANATILACDCNAEETSDAYRVLGVTLQNAARIGGWAWGDIPPVGTRSEHRLERLDYVFFHGGVRPAGEYVVENSGGSDHHPLLVVFDLTH